MNVKLTLAEIFSRSLLTSEIDFSRKEDNLEDKYEVFYTLNTQDAEKKNTLEKTTIDTSTGERKVEILSLGEFIRRFGMQSRWYLI